MDLFNNLKHSCNHSGFYSSHIINNYWMRFLWYPEIIKVEVWVISRRLRLITRTKTLSILDIAKTESDDCFIIHWTKKNGSHVFASSLTGSNTKCANLTWLPWPWVSLRWLLYNLLLWRHGCWFRKFAVRFRPIRKELESSMYKYFLLFLQLILRNTSTLNVILTAQQKRTTAFLIMPEYHFWCELFNS